MGIYRQSPKRGRHKVLNFELETLAGNQWTLDNRANSETTILVVSGFAYGKKR
jgi:hypothetical protein